VRAASPLIRRPPRLVASVPQRAGARELVELGIQLGDAGLGRPAHTFALLGYDL
jgi:hypothetical protein